MRISWLRCTTRHDCGSPTPSKRGGDSGRMRDDDRAILTAAARAEEASALLLVLGGREIEREEAEPISEAA